MLFQKLYGYLVRNISVIITKVYIIVISHIHDKNEGVISQ